MSPAHPELHLADDILDRYSMGNLQADSATEVELHLFACALCQFRLTAVDEFVSVFRAAAIEVLRTPHPMRQPWAMVVRLRSLQWAGAALGIALAVGTFLVREMPKHIGNAAPAAILIQSFRGPDSAATVVAGRPALLLFDVPANVNPADCRLEIVELNGNKVFETGTTLKGGRLEALADHLRPGNYWARLYRNSDSELLGEYSLKAEKK